MIKNEIYSREDINTFSGNGNSQVGIKVKTKHLRNKNEKLFATVIMSTKKETYNNIFIPDTNILQYHMKDDSGKVNPKGQECNRVVVETNGAHIFLELKNIKNAKRYRYLGFCNLNRYSWDERYFYFDIDQRFADDFPENQNLIIDLNKEFNNDDKKYISLTTDKKLNNVVFDYFADFPIDLEFEEGNIAHTIIKLRKRSSKLRKLAIKKYGYICNICKNNCQEKYKDRVVMHVHHIKPLHTLINSVHNSLDDIIVVCPNCHFSLHKKDEITINELKNIIYDDSVINLSEFDW